MGGTIVPIPGKERRASLEENARALEFEFSAELPRISEVAQPEAVARKGYPEAAMKSVDN